MRKAQRNARALRKVKRRGPHVMTATSGVYTVLFHRSTRKKGWWQATFFDENMEPWGDSEAPTWERLLDHVRYEIDWTTAEPYPPEAKRNPAGANLAALERRLAGMVSGW
jgi:hypothetical protein